MAILTGGLLGGELHGSAGNATLVRTRYGVQLRDRTAPHDPKTELQLANRARHREAMRAWPALSFEAVARWKAAFPTGGNDAQNAFAAHYKLLLRLDPAAAPPETPPASAFFGDAISVDASPSPSGSSWRGGRGERSGSDPEEALSDTPTLPSTWEATQKDSLRRGLSSPPSADPPKGEESSILFIATAPNAPGVLTELRLQPLAGPHRRAYLEKYRSAAFVAFDAGLVAAVPCAPGWTACAYRFVRAATGQATALAEIGRVLVA